ncbi:insulin-like growth factor-binding protein complex acid labile subunit [Nasonia vitripennis]|uniref:Uncharacterized protein n=1 Tax=Nasonia vitripennis TaxID=7425 RepID=A0A7M7J3S4_NASVI|nr:insulin-like growth factor-binding protein complex acid labile subunit [Nasonia vitripennis]
MFRLISLMLCIGIASALIFDLPPEGPIQFPLRNVQNSISYEYNSNYESNYTSEFHQYFNNNKGYILNLPKLGLPVAPNPYPGFIESKNVVTINLRENGIFRVSPGSFDGVPNMQYLDLSKNRLAFCDFFNYGSCLQMLETLVIEENQLPGDSLYREISKAGCFPHLQHLFIRKNHIQRLNFSLRMSFPSLVSLYLSDNEIDNCAFIRDVPSSLTHLYIERNRISSISTAIIQNLRTLKADGNTIQSICYRNCDRSSIKLLGTTRLETLSLSENKITRIEACAFRDSFSLTSLNLSGNMIETINPSTFTSLRNLVQLRLDNNLLTSVPNLNGNWNLKSLSLRNNRLAEIRWGAFSGVWCQKLQNLQLSGNNIRIIEENSFTDLIELAELDLSNNQLDVLPVGWMQSLRKLSHLDLRRNRFANIYQLSLVVSTSLTQVYLQNNMLDERVKAEIQQYCPFAQIHLESCKLTCSVGSPYAMPPKIYTPGVVNYKFNYTSTQQTKIKSKRHSFNYGKK